MQPFLKKLKSSGQDWALPYLAVLYIALPFAVLSSLGPVDAHVPVLLCCLGVAFVTYWIFCVEGFLSLSVGQVFLVGIFLRLCLLPMPACDDMYRYIWEGKILSLGFNPFRLPPDSPALAHFRDASWALINHPHMPTLYPPVTEAIFALIARISLSAWVFKSVFILFDVASFFLLHQILKSQPLANGISPARSLAIYFLNPLLILEIAGRGHFDSIPIFCNVAFLWSMHLGKTWAPVSLIVGTLSKINSLALLPILFLRLTLKRALAWSLVLGLAVGITFQATGMLQVLGRFTTHFHFNSVVPFILEKVLPFFSVVSLRILGGILMGSYAVFLFIRLRQAPLARQSLGFMGLLLLFSPTLHSWYILWILPFAALCLSRPWLLLSGTILATYLVYGQAYLTGQWLEIPWLWLPEFIPPLALWLVLKTKSPSAQA